MLTVQKLPATLPFKVRVLCCLVVSPCVFSEEQKTVRKKEREERRGEGDEKKRKGKKKKTCMPARGRKEPDAAWGE